ncbi:MAG: hypothetical protein KAT77_06070 [Nanoarchaeota archaeon]|nr:hypothetical protein [Nanoarchaeota archaeon]
MTNIENVLEEFIPIPAEIQEKSDALASENPSEMIKNLYNEVKKRHAKIKSEEYSEADGLTFEQYNAGEGSRRNSFYVLAVQTLRKHICKRIEDEPLRNYASLLMQTREHDLQLSVHEPRQYSMFGLQRFFASKLPSEDIKKPEDLPKFRAKGREDVLKKHGQNIADLKDAYFKSRPNEEEAKAKLGEVYEMFMSIRNEMRSPGFEISYCSETNHTIGTSLSWSMGYFVPIKK